MEELNAKNYELELKLKEKSNLIEMLKSESVSFSGKLNQLEEELNKKFDSEKLDLKEELENKIKNYEELIQELNEKKSEGETGRDNLVVNLRKENEQLGRKLDDLKIAYDDLVDEKNNLKSSLAQIKSNPSNDSNEINRLNSMLKEKERIISDLESRLSVKLKSVYEDSLGYTATQTLKYNTSRSLMAESSDQDSLGSKNNLYNQCLESTEIDYLRQIIYSYMMGVDRVVSFIQNY